MSCADARCRVAAVSAALRSGESRGSMTPPNADATQLPTRCREKAKATRSPRLDGALVTPLLHPGDFSRLASRTQLPCAGAQSTSRRTAAAQARSAPPQARRPVSSSPPAGSAAAVHPGSLALVSATDTRGFFDPSSVLFSAVERIWQTAAPAGPRDSPHNAAPLRRVRSPQRLLPVGPASARAQSVHASGRSIDAHVCPSSHLSRHRLFM